jgi:hypothetical protein
MAKRIVRLSEAELIHLVKRVVKEQKEIGEGWLGDKFGWVKDAAKEVAQLFKTDVLPEIPKEELDDLKMKARKLDARDALAKVDDFASSEKGKKALEKAEKHISPDVLSEAILNEAWLSDRVIRILAKVGVIGGIGLTATGFLSFASMLMGYIDSGFLTKVHGIVESFGCGTFCGPLTFLVIVLGAAIAFGSAVIGYDKKERK